MPRPRSITRAGTSVRFPLDDLEDYRELAGLFLSPKPLSGLLIELTMEVIEYFTPNSRQDIGFQGGGIIQDIQARSSRVSLCDKIATRSEKGLRVLPNEDTQAIWLGFSREQTDRILALTKFLGWPQGKLVQQAVMDAVVLASSDGIATQVPVLAKFYWGLKLFEQGVNDDMILQLSAFLDKWKRERNDRENPPDEKALDVMTVEGLDLVD